jgi:hypothetical protein
MMCLPGGCASTACVFLRWCRGAWSSRPWRAGSPAAPAGLGWSAIPARIASTHASCNTALCYTPHCYVVCFTLAGEERSWTLRFCWFKAEWLALALREVVCQPRKFRNSIDLPAGFEIRGCPLSYSRISKTIINIFEQIVVLQTPIVALSEAGPLIFHKGLLCH